MSVTELLLLSIEERAQPMSVASQPRPEPDPDLPSRDLRNRPQLLIVEDDELVRISLAQLLEESGFDVVGQAADGEEGVRLAAELSPVVVLMDLRMPKMDGIEATRLIKLRDPSVQVVILSAYEDAGLQRSAEETGVTCYLVKGCRPSHIHDVLLSVAELGRGLRARGRTLFPPVEIDEAGR